jgi:hypothetical protein
MKANSPNEGKPEVLGPPPAVKAIEEPIIKEAVTMPIVSRLAARSTWSPNRLSGTISTCT